MPTEPTPPALTPEQWSAGEYRGTDMWAAFPEDGTVRSSVLLSRGEATGPDRHALAALCLHEQSFGFRQEDLHVLAAEIALLEIMGDHASNHGALAPGSVLPSVAQLRSLASRIASLLPPQT